MHASRDDFYNSGGGRRNTNNQPSTGKRQWLQGPLQLCTCLSITEPSVEKSSYLHKETCEKVLGLRLRHKHEAMGVDPTTHNFSCAISMRLESRIHGRKREPGVLLVQTAHAYMVVVNYFSLPQVFLE